MKLVKQEFFLCSVLTPANGTILSLHGPVCIQNNYFQFVFSLKVKKDGT